jgi:hypothetical protein
MTVIRDSFLVGPKGIGALRYVSIEVVVVWVFRVQREVEDVGILVRKHSGEAKLRRYVVL